MKKALLLGWLSLSTVVGATQFEQVEITAQAVNKSVYMLKGAGGNIGVSAGKEGVLIVDDQFKPLADKITEALRELNPGKLKYVINTHYHKDHTGGNEVFLRIAPVIAHENVRSRLAQKSDSGLPVITYEKGMKVYFNDEVIHLIHLPKGHTDGDSLVFFEGAKVLHMGDLYFEGRFPYIDLDAGGSVQGYIDNVKYVYDNFADDIQLIPGHGKLSDRKSLSAYIAMMEQTRALVLDMKKRGLSLQQAIDTGLGDKYKPWHWSFITEEKWIRTLYKDA